MSAAFTPGPWSLRLGSLRASVETPSGNWFKSHKDGESEKSIAADARLIAAAPELYEALLLVSRNSGRLSQMDWQRVEAALAKARGEQ